MRGADFKARRERLRLTQPDAAALFEVALRTIRNWENDDTRAPAIASYAFDAWDAMTNEEMYDLIVRAYGMPRCR